MPGQGRVVLSSDIAVELGSRITRVYLSGERESELSRTAQDADIPNAQRGIPSGIVLEEPSVVAMDRNTHEVREAGFAANDLVNDAPDRLELVRPVRYGVIADERLAQRMLRRFLRPYLGSVFSRACGIATVPLGATHFERRAAQETLRRAGLAHVDLVSSPLAAAIGAGLSVAEPEGSCVVVVDAEFCESAIVSLGSVVAHAARRTGFESVMSAIANFMRREYGLFITDTTSLDIIEMYGKTVDDSEVLCVHGVSIADREPCIAYLERSEIERFVLDYFEHVAETLRTCIAQAKPETSCDIAASGVRIVGVGARIPGMAAYLSNRFAIPVYVAHDPETAIITGAGSCLVTIGTESARDLFMVV